MGKPLNAVQGLLHKELKAGTAEVGWQSCCLPSPHNSDMKLSAFLLAAKVYQQIIL